MPTDWTVAAPNELPMGTRLLRNQYQLQGTLQEGGFGITYLARDSLDRQVVIKECFPEAICCRDELNVRPRSAAHVSQFESVIENFIKEARRLARLQHPNIVNVHQVFEENGTAYMAMDHVEGIDLLTLAEECPERLSRDVLETALCDTLDALIYVHSLGILHRDISPDNIMIDGTGHVTLIDFGAARDNFLRRDRALTALLAVKDGYSPHEFYLEETDQQACSDLYSLAATFYHLISGHAPVDSQTRVACIASGKLDPYRSLNTLGIPFDPIYLDTIDRCLAISQKDRIQTAEEWRNLLRRDATQAPQPITKPVDLTASVVDDIAALVEETNKDLEKTAEMASGESGSKKRETHRLVLHPVRAEPSAQHLVDLFGNPIHDVDAWLQEQDALIAQKNAEAHTQEDDVETIPVSIEHSATSGGVATFFSRIFRPARLSTS